MPDHYSKQQYSGEDNEIEIVDLSTIRKGDATEVAGSRRISLSARYSPGQRRHQLLISGSIIATLLLILIGISPVRDLVIGSLFPPAPGGPAREVGQDAFFYLQTIPAWGKWYLDDKQLTRVPVFSDEKPLRIAAGKHTLAWRAEPFQELSCTLLVPPDLAHQTCHTRRQGENAFASSSNVVSLPVPPSIAQLPQAQRQALLQATRNYLDTFQSSETVHPGEMYRYNTAGAAHLARQAMQARLHFQLDTDTSAPARCGGPQLGPACTNAANGSDCRLFCTLAWSERDTPDRLASWDVGVVTRPSWEYVAPGQQTDSEAGRPENQGDQQFTTLHITWQQNAWHVTAHPQGDSPFDDPNCIAVVSKIPNILPLGRASGGDEGQQIVRNFTSGSDRAMGCLATARVEKTANPGQPPIVSHAYFLWRFNVLLAVNDEAHQLWPDLPLSGPAGKSIVQEITNHIAFAS
ncbi:MAG: hypothetical protein NVS4B9_09280 [Ktedonobacteraceae bacterium]